MSELSEHRNERIETTLDNLDEKVVESTKDLALEIYEKYINIQPSTCLALAFYLNNKPISQKDSAIKFNKSVQVFKDYIPELPEDLGLDESDYKKDKGIKREKTTTWITLQFADRFDWVEGEHYSTRKDSYGNIQASIKRKGMVDIWENFE